MKKFFIVLIMLKVFSVYSIINCSDLCKEGSIHIKIKNNVDDIGVLGYLNVATARMINANTCQFDNAIFIADEDPSMRLSINKCQESRLTKNVKLFDNVNVQYFVYSAQLQKDTGNKLSSYRTPPIKPTRTSSLPGYKPSDSQSEEMKDSKDDLEEPETHF